MSNNHVNEIKKEDKKAFKKFIIVLIISAIVGGVMGFMSVYLRDTLGSIISTSLINIFEVITPFASLVLSILIIIVSAIVYNKSKKEFML